MFICGNCTNDLCKQNGCRSLTVAQGAPQPRAWLAEYDGNIDTTIYRDTAERWSKSLGRKVIPLYSDPVINECVCLNQCLALSGDAAAVTEGMRQTAAASDVKPIYVKRWRTLVMVSTAYADQIRDILNASSELSSTERR